MEMSWPKVGLPNYFAGEGGDGWTNACISKFSDNHEAMCMGYSDAADLLITKVIKECRWQDTMVYPILFLYRHHIELRMKESIFLAHRLLGREHDDLIHHRLLDLWRITRPLIREIEPKGPEETLKAVDEQIARLNRVDPLSMSFRYTKDKHGKRLLDGITHINLEAAKNDLGSLTNFFDSISAMLNEYYTSMCDGMSDAYRE